MIPYAQRILSDYLRTHPAVSAIIGTRVVSDPPKETKTAWVQVRQLNAIDAGPPIEHLIDFHFQFDCYVAEGEGTPQAFLLGRTVREAITSLNGTVGAAVVTGTRMTEDFPLLDPDINRLRQILGATIWMHN